MSPAPRLLDLAPALAGPARLPRARTAVTLGAAVAILGATLFGLDVPSGLAQGDYFDDLFGGGHSSFFPSSPGYRVKKSRVRSWRPRAARYVKVRQARRVKPRIAKYTHLRRVVSAGAVRSRPAARVTVSASRLAVVTARPAVSASRPTVVAARPAVVAARPAATGRRSVCVRGCDGYFFPLATGGASDLTAQQTSCAKVCPGSETRLFLMRAGSDKIEDAVAARGGQPYSQFTARFNSDEAKQNAACSCHETAGNPVDPSAFLNDFTLRPGDSVVTPKGVRVLKVGSRYPYQPSDFLSLADTHNVPTATRGALSAIEKAMKTPRGRAAVNDKRHDGRSRREQRSENAPDAAAPKAQAD